MSIGRDKGSCDFVEAESLHVISFLCIEESKFARHRLAFKALFEK